MRTTISDLLTAIKDANLESHAEVIVEGCESFECRNRNGNLVIFGENELKARNTELEKSALKADQAVESAMNQLKEARTHLEP